ncbi:hypothetical protein CORC01_11164 [Colletotrichum orchidophilum]|uniref:Peptidase S8/S53 domain-containing protein n=1 Tax=Colletotrichum orchidophilum TaxID=1209926 RepID=A0A1G4AWQ4_9PEZI|nr:uncharacterized protein CORC01_11164 [Colletotrichum orchidophilum]OHE93567.1 hypothetical protein CORC01_11164 [Colletotrichum orchidophilum]
MDHVTNFSQLDQLDRSEDSDLIDDEEEAIYSISTQLYPSDGKADYRTRNSKADPFQRTTVVDRDGVVSIRCKILDVVHGTMSPDNPTSFATLNVFKCAFISRRHSRRASSADVELVFKGRGAGAPDPEVVEIAPQGKFCLMPETEENTVTREVSGGVTVPLVGGPGAEGMLKWQEVGVRQKKKYTTVIGEARLLGRNEGEDDSAAWTLLENPITCDGVPEALTGAILLKRRDGFSHFQCDFSITVKTDRWTAFANFFKSLPLDDPILFDPRLPPTNKLMIYATNSLANISLRDFENINIMKIKTASVPLPSTDPDADYESDNSEGSEYYSGIDDQPEENLLARLENELAEKIWDFQGRKDDQSRKQREELLSKFFSQHSSTIRSKTPHFLENIFHILARIREPRISKLKLLVYWVVQHHWQLLTEHDRQGMTGFHLAIQSENHKLVRYLLDAYTKYHKADESGIENILGATYHENNSLHLAMKDMTPILGKMKQSGQLEAIIKLIDNASTKILTTKNEHGFTPLHLAVEAKKCTPQQLIIIKKLVERCDASLDVRGGKDGTYFSPYQYLMRTYQELPELLGVGTGSSTRNANLKSKNTDDGRMKAATKSPLDQIGRVKRMYSAEKPRNQVYSSELTPTQEVSDHPSSITDTNQYRSRSENLSSYPVKGGQGSNNFQKPDSGETPGQRSNNTQSLQTKPTMDGPKTSLDGNTSVLSREQQTQFSTTMAAAQMTPGQKNSTKTKTNQTQDRATTESVNEIATFLKHVYLRKRSRHLALDFLYGGFSDRQIDFNLNGKKGEISEEDFTLGYQCAKLEDTLQSVCIPNLTIKPLPPIQPVGKPDDDIKLRQEHPSRRQPVVGRTDLGIIFDWLQNKAKVKKIIKLDVDDSNHPPHCDEAIEKATKPFDIEVWNWVKIDLCCDTIAKVAPKARHIMLYWSGNNAVLRGWSDSRNGLARLQYLEKVDVFLRSGVEGMERNAKNFKSFQDRLKLRQPRLTITLFDQENLVSATRIFVKKENALHNHKWLKCMDSFSGFIRNVRLSDSQTKSLKPIRIAIIDDGIDTTERKLHGRVSGGQCFCSQDESPSFCVSADGHGTTMAHQISRVFPFAEIISLKLDEHAQSNGTSQFSVRSAADAVQYAKKLNVSIINMSWSVEPTDANKDWLLDLRDSLMLADKNNILMFCAASDQGKTADKSYPGQYSRGPQSTLFKIGAATATGAEYHYVSLKDVDFLFPGRVVEKEQDEEVADSAASMRPKDRSSEGSSIATAFASGLAGIILYILQLVSCYYKDDEDVPAVARYYDRIRDNPRKMKEVFERLAATNMKFVEVWRAFETAENDWRAGGDKIEILSEICTKLLGGLV